MSEMKEYVSHIQGQSNVHVSEEAINTVAAMAAIEVDGVAGLTHIGSDVASAKKNLTKAIRLRTNEDDIVLDISIVVRYGSSIQNVAKSVQDSILAAVDSVVGLNLAAVNVYVSGIALED